jgi:peptidyl-prolyl cis-trans isomerase SurA
MAVAVAFAAPTVGFAQNSEGVAVIVNDEAISTFDVRQRATLLLIGRGAQPTPELQEAVRNQALRDLVEERLKLQEAAARKVTVDDEEVDRRIDGIARQGNVTTQQLAAQFSSVGLSLNTLRQQVKADLSWRRLVSGRFSRRVRIGDREVDQEMERLMARYTRPAARIAEIMLPAESTAEIEQAERVAQRVLGEVNALEDPRQRFAAFAQVARQISAAPTAAIGGDRDWAAQGELPKPIQDAVDQMLPGQIAGPVRGPGGVYILLLASRRDGVDPATLQQANLREVTVPAGQRAALERLAGRINGCAALEGQVSGLEGVEVEDLGDIRESELSALVRDRLAGVAVGRTSAVYGKGERAAVMVVCGRSLAAEELPSRDQIREQLYERNFEILADRYLRDLRREAYIRG